MPDLWEPLIIQCPGCETRISIDWHTLGDFWSFPTNLKNQVLLDGWRLDSDEGWRLGHEDTGLWKIAAQRRSRPTIPASIRLAVYERDGTECLQCGATDDLTLDHIIPFSHGGPDTIENLRVLCRPCNSRRGNRIEV